MYRGVMMNTTIKQQPGSNSGANASANFDCKPLYFQRAPFAPPKLTTLPTSKSSPNSEMQSSYNLNENLATASDGFHSNFFPNGSASLDVFDAIDPLDWVSLPDLFFGENYQNMLPTLDITQGPGAEGCTSVFSPDPNLQPQSQGRQLMAR